MKVLVIHPSGSFGGASKSIIEAQTFIDHEMSSFSVICPVGSAAAQFSNNGYKVRQIGHISQFDNTRFGFYRKLRWLILVREFFYFLVSYRVIKSEIKDNDVDLIHFNEVTLVPWAKIIRRWTSAPIVVQVRSLQRENKGDSRSQWLQRTLRYDVEKVIAIDETVRRTLPQELSVTVIHNSLRLTQDNCQEFHHRTRFRVAIIGVLLKLKGVYEFLEAARILVEEKGYEIEFYIVGENARKLSGWKAAILKRLDLAHDVRGDIEEFVAKHSLEQHVVLTGFVEDVQSIYADLDVLCFPSHLNAAGRPVFEAAFFGVPSIVAVKDPPSDTIVDGETGICIDEPDGQLLAGAIERLFNNRDELRFLGDNARKLAHRNFDIKKNAEALFQVYQDAIAGKSEAS